MSDEGTPTPAIRATGARIAIRCDASLAIGTGHLLRCVALAEALRRTGSEVRFVLRDHDLSYVEFLAERGFAADLLAKPTENGGPPPAAAHGYWLGVAEEHDAAEQVAILAPWRPDWVVVDHYAIGAKWHRHVRAALDCRIAVIDDLADRPLDADLIVDHNAHPDHREKYRGCVMRGRPLLLLGGPRFALLSAIYQDAPAYQFDARVQSVGIFLGGVDRTNISTMAYHGCRDSGFTGQVEIVSTSANPNLNALHAALADDPAARLSLDLPDLAAFFARHDLQIGAGGGATWERCRIGAPSIVLRCSDNQSVVTAGLAAAGAALTIDAPSQIAIAEAVAIALHDLALRQTISARSAMLVDGRGAERTALAMAGQLQVRSARPDDALAVLPWRNDPVTRRNSFDSAPVDEGGHVAWWRASISNPDRSLLIGRVGEIDVGVLRLDREFRTAVVSIYLDPALTGLGLGPRLLAAGQRWLMHNWPDLEGLDAEIRPENIASRKSFEAAGFRQEGSGWTWRIPG